MGFVKPGGSAEHTWHGDGPLLAQEGVAGQRWDANTCHVGSSHLELVLHVLPQVRHLTFKSAVSKTNSCILFKTCFLVCFPPRLTL